jgi:hypothetical protein
MPSECYFPEVWSSSGTGWVRFMTNNIKLIYSKIKIET